MPSTRSGVDSSAANRRPLSTQKTLTRSNSNASLSALSSDKDDRAVKKPLTRSNSNASLGSHKIPSEKQAIAIQKEKERKRKRLSLPNAPDAPALPPAEAKVKRRMSGRRQSSFTLRNTEEKLDKENSGAPTVQGPTPYAQVVRERGGQMSPPVTRSEKKKRMKNAQKPPLSGVVLSFSPPDQERNRRMEEERIARSEAARANRVRKARESGQLLVFSPTNRDPSDKPPNFEDADDKQDTPEVEEVPPTTPHCTPPGRMSLVGDSKVASATKMTIRKDQIKEIVRETLVQTNELSLRASIEQSEHDETAMLLDDAENRRKSLEAKNATLATKCTDLTSELEELQQKLDQATQQTLVVEGKLKGELEDLQRKVAQKEKEAGAQQEYLESQLAAKISECKFREQKIATCKQELESLQSELKASKKEVACIRKESTEELEQIATENEKLEMKIALSEESNQILEDEKRELEKRAEELEQRIFHLEKSVITQYEEKLEDALAKVNMQQTIIEDMAQQSQHTEQQYSQLKDDYKSLEASREEDRTMFQALNKKSTEAFQNLQQSEAAKMHEISTLRHEADNLHATVETRNKEMSSVTAQMEEMKAAFEQLQKEMATTLQQKKHVEEQLLKASHERDEAKRLMDTVGDREQDLHHRLVRSEEVRRNLHGRVMQLLGNIRVFVRVRAVAGEERNKSMPMTSRDPSPARRTARDPSPARTTARDPSPARRPRKSEIVQPTDNSEVFRYPSMGEQETRNDELVSGAGVDDITKKTIEIKEPAKDRGGLKQRRKRHLYGFDNVFTPGDGQEKVWESTEPLVQCTVDGHNVTLFAYGQTGSGKTYTMLGEPGKEGIITRAIQKMYADKFDLESVSKGKTKVELRVELLEVYNEHVYDLLGPKRDCARRSEPLKVTSQSVEGATCLVAKNQEEMMHILSRAQSRRCVKATASNSESSRSHLVFTVHFIVAQPGKPERRGKLNICDLAGSERLDKSGANHVGGSLLEETKNINKSLSALSNVIEKLQSGTSTVIPYRESMLTTILRDSLGGNSKTLAIVCCNPLASHYHESLSSLRFAEKASKVELKAQSDFSC